MRGRNRDTDVKNGYMDTVQEGEGKLGEWDCHMYITKRKTGSKLCKDLEECDSRVGRYKKEEIRIYT